MEPQQTIFKQIFLQIDKDVIWQMFTNKYKISYILLET